MSRKRSSRSNRLRLEHLERRELLAADLGFRHNSVEPLDVNNDSAVTALDALEVVNELNRQSIGRERTNDGRQRFLDVNNDSAVTPVDVLNVINRLNRRDGIEPNRNGNPTDGDRGGSKQEDSPNSTQTPGFASVDGTGNNVENPEFGAAGQAFQRILSANFVDGVSEPNDGALPSARLVSNVVNASPGAIENASGLSDLTWLFGQFIDHDITLTGHGDGEAYNIEVPVGDAWFDPFGTGEAVIGLERSGATIGENGAWQQFNEITAFIDGSVIYGSSQEIADTLRTFEGGLLKTSEGDLLPFDIDGLASEIGEDGAFFLAGDVRANENAALTAMHTIWVREHNHVASRIASENPELGDEEIYQRARQFVASELQAITFNEFLPALLGDNAIADYTGYDPSVNPNLSNEFSTAAYRFGHTMLPSQLQRLDADGNVVAEGNLSLQNAFFNPDVITEGGIDSLLRGAAAQVAQEVDTFVVDDVRNFLFGPPGAGGFDLASLNIQRGREHGLQSFSTIRESLGLGEVNFFSEISSDPEVQQRLEEAYGDPKLVDAWVGMLAEDHATGSALGRTATAIIADQFAAIRDGDRFYFENVFSGRQLDELQRTTLAQVIERNSNVDFAHGDNVFLAEPVQEFSFSDPADDEMLDQLAKDRVAPPIETGGIPDGERDARRLERLRRGMQDLRGFNS